MDIPRKKSLKARIGKFILPFATVCAVISGLAFLFFKGTAKANIPESHRSSLIIDEVKMGRFDKKVSGVGSLQPIQFEWLTTKAKVTVKEVFVKPGAIVDKDIVIMQLTSPELVESRDIASWSLQDAISEKDSQTLTLQNQLLNLKAELAKLISDYEFERVKLDAESDLVEKGIISRVNFRQTEIRTTSLKNLIKIEQERISTFEKSVASQLDILANRVALLEKQLKTRQADVDALTVRSSLEGVVQEVIVENGQTLSPGAQMALVTNTGNLIAELRIPESYARDLTIDQQAIVDTRNGKVEGYLSRIDPRVINGTVLVDITFTAPLPQNARPDQNVEGVIHIKRLDDIKYINKPVLVAENSVTDVFVVNAKSNIAQKKRVTFGLSSVDKIQVIKGLDIGDNVIISDVSQWNSNEQLLIK